MGTMKDIRLWGILLLALAVRTAMLFSVFAEVKRARTADSADYLALAWTMSDGGRYSQRFPQPDFERQRRADANDGSVRYGGSREPEIFRTPGYPALLAAVDMVKPGYARGWMDYVARPDSATPPTSLQIVLSFQVLLDLHLVLLTFFLGRSLAGHGAGLLTALFQAICPLAAAASCRILSDGIFAFMLTAAVLLLLRHFRTGGWWSLLSAGLMMGAACYVRPVGLAFSAVMAMVVLCSRRSTGILPVSGMGVPPMPWPKAPSFAEATEGKRPRRLLRTLAFATVVVACVAPWVARNAIVADYWWFSSFATDSMYWYSAAEIEARQQHKSVQSMREAFSSEEDFDTQVILKQTRDPYLTPGDLARYRWDKARTIILAHPWEFLDIHLRGDLAFWLPDATEALEVLGYTSGGKGTLDVLHRQGLIAAAKHYFGDNTTAMALAGAMVVLLLVRYAGIVLCGLWRLRLRMSAAGWLCLLLVLTAWLLPGPANHPRFRVPVEPILSAAAAIGYLGLLQWRRRRAGAAQSV
jgi:hypothetical protein